MESAHGTGIPSEQLIGVVRGVRNRYRAKRALRGAAITVAASWAILAASAYAMNAMRYDAAAVGNHEFNYGVPFLERTVRQARFPVLAANARRPDGSHAFGAWTMVERAGVKIGIVGATTPGSMVWDRDNLRGRVVLGDIVSAVREAVTEARGAGAQIIVVTMHSGLAEPATYDTAATGLPSDNVAARVAREVPGVDLIAYGHSHKEMADTTVNGVHATGGSLDGAGPVIAGGIVLVNSGYPRFGGTPGNVLLAFGLP